MVLLPKEASTANNTLRRAVDLLRAVATNRETVDEYFDLLEETMFRNGLCDKSSQFFNCDESGFPLDHERGKLIAVKRWKHFWSASSCSRDRITVLACVSATGYAIFPLVIYDRKNIQQEFHRGEIPATMFDRLPKGGLMQIYLKNGLNITLYCMLHLQGH